MKRWIVAALVLALGLMLAGCAKGNVDAWHIADAKVDNRMFNADGTPRIWEG